MSNQKGRRHRRIAYAGPVRLAWEISGEPKFALGKCIEISESGLRVEVPAPIPLKTALLVSAERIDLSGAATVKHVKPHRAKFIVGVELCSALHGKALAAVRAPAEPRV